MTARARCELLVVPDCPSEQEAGNAFRVALATAEMDRATFDTVVISTLQHARERAFIGSPSFYINGNDILPIATASPALACRVYRSESGDLAGTPDSGTLVVAIRRAV